jgi:hypothetical protein
MIEVQVKTIRSGNWPLGRKGRLRDLSGREWFVFVKLGLPPGLPESYVVPRDHVAAATWIGHHAWRTDPEVEPGRRNAPLELARVGVETWVGYRDRWDQLAEETESVPVLLPCWTRDPIELDRIGLPPDHPWNDRQRIPEWPTAAAASAGSWRGVISSFCRSGGDRLAVAQVIEALLIVARAVGDLKASVAPKG